MQLLIPLTTIVTEYAIPADMNLCAKTVPFRLPIIKMITDFGAIIAAGLYIRQKAVLNAALWI